MKTPHDIKIHPLPNLMTAGNLFCGFMAVLLIFKGHAAGGMEQLEETSRFYTEAILFIFGACFFDLLDGRVARISGQESDFGREFDSIADVVSFGLAPALLLMDIVLYAFDEIGQVLAFVYLLSGAMRLARFNCVAALAKGDMREFHGVPIPVAAGLISSITLAMLHLGKDHIEVLDKMKFLLPVLMLGLSYLMFSNVRYTSLKDLNWRTQRSIPAVLIAIVVAAFTVRFFRWMPAVLFTSYLVYGLVRPWVSGRWRREIEG